MTATLDTTQSDVFAAIRAFLLGVLPPEVEIIKANDNSVPMPQGPFVCMAPGKMERLSTNLTAYHDPGNNPACCRVVAFQP